MYMTAAHLTGGAQLERLSRARSYLLQTIDSKRCLKALPYALSPSRN